MLENPSAYNRSMQDRDESALIIGFAVVAGRRPGARWPWGRHPLDPPGPSLIAFAPIRSPGPSAPPRPGRKPGRDAASSRVERTPQGASTTADRTRFQFDDASIQPWRARKRRRLPDSPCVAVLGHFLSSTSLAGRAGHTRMPRIPAADGSSAADDLTSAMNLFSRADADLHAGAPRCEQFGRCDEEPKVPPLSHTATLRREFCELNLRRPIVGAVVCSAGRRLRAVSEIDGRCAEYAARRAGPRHRPSASAADFCR